MSILNEAVRRKIRQLFLKKKPSRDEETISEATRRKIRQIFPADRTQEVAGRLANECGNNLYGFESADKYALERIHFAVLKLSKGNLSELRRWIASANTDWRDVLAAAGFAHSETAHKEWRIDESAG
jgi:hypothetical protein